MKNYPTVTSDILNFTVTILGSVAPVVPDQVCTLSTHNVDIKYEPFKVIPENYNVGPYTIDAFIFTGADLPEQIDFSSDCLTNIKQLDWISLDFNANTLTVHTQNNKYVGDHKIILVQSF